jgi:LPXTG-site transpeptidase (sortase) family protein
VQGAPVGARSNSTHLRWLERVLVAFGIVCVGYYGYHTVQARNFQREQIAAFEAMLEQSSALGATPSASRDAVAPASSVASTRASRARVELPADRDATPGKLPRAVAEKSSRGGLLSPSVMAIVEIPRLSLSSPVVSGDDSDVLDVAIGHLPDTPKPWEPGNSALSAHRDGLFRSLRRVRVGDTVRVRSQHGDFVYTVRETKIVEPDDLSVLAPTDTQTLTLITCYPFNFIGPAPKRFIVHAERLPAEEHQPTAQP